MSYERINKRGLLCKCEHADCPKHTKPWFHEGLDVPARCAGCKRTSWNGTDKRRGKFTRVRVAQKVSKP